MPDDSDYLAPCLKRTMLMVRFCSAARDLCLFEPHLLVGFMIPRCESKSRSTDQKWKFLWSCGSLQKVSCLTCFAV